MKQNNNCCSDRGSKNRWWAKGYFCNGSPSAGKIFIASSNIFYGRQVTWVYKVIAIIAIAGVASTLLVWEGGA